MLNQTEPHPLTRGQKSQTRSDVMTNSPGLHHKVLCVDDQQEILDLLERQIGNEYDCVMVTSPTFALQMLQEKGPFAAVISDYSMSEMNGVEMLREAAMVAPHAVGIMLTASKDLNVAVDALHRGQIFRFITKPWEALDIQRAVQEAVMQYRLVTSEKHFARELADKNEELDRRLTQVRELNTLLEYWVEFSPAVIYSATVEDSSPRPTYVSRNIERLCGFDRAKMIANPDFWWQRVHQDDQAALAATLREVCQQQLTHAGIKYRIHHANGQQRWVQDAFRVQRDAHGAAVEIVGAWLDVGAVQA